MDKELRPLSTISVDSSWGGSDLTPFPEINEGGFYTLATDVRMAERSTNGAHGSIDFDYDQGGAGDTWVGKYIYQVTDIGGMNLVSQNKDDMAYGGMSDDMYNYKLKNNSGLFELYGQKSILLPHNHQVATSVKHNGNLILYFKRTLSYDVADYFVVIAPIK